MHHTLGHIEYSHNDIPGVAHNEDGAGTLENPFEEHPGVHVIKIIPFGEHLNQLQCHHQCQDDSGDGKDNGRRKVSHHVEDTAVPCLGCQPYLGGDFPHLFIYTVEQPGEVADDAADEQLFQPIRDSVHQKTYG